MKKQIAILISALLLASTGLAQEINVDPGTYTENVLPGDNLTKNISMTWKGEAPVVAQLSTSETSEDLNSNGFNIRYSNQQFILEPDKTRTEQVYFNTSIDLKPADYNFDTKASIKYIVKTETKTDTDTVYRDSEVNIVRINNTDNTSKQQNLTKQEIINLYNDLIGNENTTAPEHNQSIESNASQEDIEELKQRINALRQDNSDLESRNTDLLNTAQNTVVIASSTLLLILAVLIASIYGGRLKNHIPSIR